MSMDFNTKGKLCSICFGEACPGINVFDAEPDEIGCPYWCSLSIEGDIEPETWTGCGVLMEKRLILGVTISANRAAVSMQSARNVIASGFIGLAKSSGDIKVVTEMARSIREADKATNSNKRLEEIS